MTTAVPTLHEIAERIEAGDEFRNGEWVETTPVDGLSEFWPWMRRPFRDGVNIARQVIAEQLHAIADWEWTDE